MSSIDLAIKFGSNEIIIYRKGFGIIAKEPAYLAVVENGKKLKVKATGKRAQKLFYSKSDEISVFQPFVNGEIVDEKMATMLISEILHSVIKPKNFISGISAVVAVPCGLNFEQLKAIKKVLKASGVNKTKFVANAVCVRELLDLDENDAIAVVDIGKTITDIAVLNGFEIFKGSLSNSSL